MYYIYYIYYVVYSICSICSTSSVCSISSIFSIYISHTYTHLESSICNLLRSEVAVEKVHRRREMVVAYRHKSCHTYQSVLIHVTHMDEYSFMLHI